MAQLATIKTAFHANAAIFRPQVQVTIRHVGDMMTAELAKGTKLCRDRITLMEMTLARMLAVGVTHAFAAPISDEAKELAARAFPELVNENRVHFPKVEALEAPVATPAPAAPVAPVAQKLKDILDEAQRAALATSKVAEMADVEIVAVHKPADKAWRGKQRNVQVWAELANGKSVAVNVNPTQGVSFPVMATAK